MEEREYQEKLAQVRQDIDAIDQELLPLFLRRMRCSERVAALKGAAGQPVYHPERERRILERVRQEAGEMGEQAAAFYAALMAISRARQQDLLGGGEELRALVAAAATSMPEKTGLVLCQGVEGAYSHRAAKRLFGPSAPIAFTPTWQQVFEGVNAGEADFGVLPVENSAAGSVTGVYDLILRYRFYIVGAADMKVEHCLASWQAEGPLERAVSHPQALAQCSDYLAAHGLSPMEFSNTAAAARYVAQEHPAATAAICSQEAAEQYGLAIRDSAIQNEKNNTTRFIVISREPILPEDANKISLCFSLPHTPGALVDILQRFAQHGLNMTKIESRPIPGSSCFEYDFYLDFTGNVHQSATLSLICALQEELPRFSFLGNYSER